MKQFLCLLFLCANSFILSTDGLLQSYRSSSLLTRQLPKHLHTTSTTQLLQNIRSGNNDESSTKVTTFPKLIAEAFGTFLIVQLGTGAVMSAMFTANSLPNLFSIAMVWAIAVTLAIYSTGGHLNPAVTIALATLRHFPWARVLPYIAAQLCGAVLGSTINYIMYASHIEAFEISNGLLERTAAVASAKAFGEYFSCSPIIALLAESIGTFVLASVIFALTHPKNKSSTNVPIWIGLTVAANICVIAPITQAGFNPARDFGPRIVAYLFGWKQVAFKGAWVYILGPILGALAGGFFVDRILFRERVNTEE